MNSLIDAQQLAGMRDREDTVILDASLHLPAAGRNAREEFAAGHIPGARSLDLTTLTDPASSVPATVPTAEQFAGRLRELGVSAGDRVVLYDDSAIRSSARAWFLFELYGWRDAAILDGGLAAWRSGGYPLESGFDDIEPSALSPDALVFRPELLRDKESMLANVAASGEQVLDARDEGRFSGEAQDTAGGLRQGHIPGARNLPFGALYTPEGLLRSEAELAALFVEAGIALDRPVVTSCNSGVTACTLLFAARRLGAEQLALYDGSWLEWGSDPATPKALGKGG